LTRERKEERKEGRKRGRKKERKGEKKKKRRRATACIHATGLTTPNLHAGRKQMGMKM
jgi:hypothetical protein